MNHNDNPVSLHPLAIESGLTKREYFAISAMQGLIAASHGSGTLPHYYAEKFAVLACAYADALLEKLERDTEKEIPY